MPTIVLTPRVSRHSSLICSRAPGVQHSEHVGCHSSGDVLFDLLLQMKTEFVVQFVFDLRPPQQRSQAQDNLIRPSAWLHASFVCTTRLIALDSRSQFASSFSIWVLPARVNE